MKVKGTILFTDIVGSTKLWNKHKKKMFDAIKEHFRVIKRLSRKYKGKVVKTIGDASMLYFGNIGNNSRDISSLYRAIDFARELQSYKIQITSSIPLKHLKFRIGMAYGTMDRERVNIQGCNQIDYFGPVVNIASRMESKVSKVGGVAFYTSKKLPITFLSSLPNLEKIKVSQRCAQSYVKSAQKNKRSGRLVYKNCYTTKEVKGVGRLDAYRFHDD